MISSRRQKNVQQAVEKLKEEKLDVAGVVCHVGKQEDRTQLIKEASEINVVAVGTVYRTILFSLKND